MAYNAEVAMREADEAIVVTKQAKAVAEAKQKADEEIMLMEKRQADERRKREQAEEREKRRMEEERRRNHVNGRSEETRKGLDPMTWPRYV